MKTRSKLLSIALSLVLAVGLCPLPAFAGSDLKVSASSALTTQAAAHTQAEAVAWAQARANEHWEINDGSGWTQCTEFVWAYYEYLLGYHVGGHAYQYLTDAYGACPYGDGWTRPSKSDVRPGDIVIWGQGAWFRADGSDYAGNAGHIGVVISVNGNSMVTAETNAGEARGACGYKYNREVSCIGGLIRPNWPNSGASSVSVAAGTYLVRSKIGGRVLDVVNGSSDNCANIQLWDSAGVEAQIFNIGWNNDIRANYIQLRSSGKFVDAQGGDGAVNVWQFEGNGGRGQNWVFEDAGDGWVYIRNLYGYYLDVSNGEDRNGANVQTFTFNGSDAQKWKLLPTSGKKKTTLASGKYAIRSKIGSRVLDVVNGSTANKANVQLWSPTGVAAQIFTIGFYSPLGANYIQLASSDKFIDAQGGDGAVNVWQFEGNGGKGQNWFFEDAGGGYYYIRNVYGYYLDVSGGADKDGANVQTFTFNGSDAQKWKITKISGKTNTTQKAGIYSVQTKLGDLVLDVKDASSANKADVRLAAPAVGDSQAFSVGWNRDLSAHYIQLKSSGKFLDAAGGDGAVNVWQFEGNGGKGQNWFFEDAGGGYYYIRNLYGFYLAVDGGKAAEGQNVSTAVFAGTDAQKWRLVAPASSAPSGNVEDTASGESSGPSKDASENEQPGRDDNGGSAQPAKGDAAEPDSPGATEEEPPQGNDDPVSDSQPVQAENGNKPDEGQSGNVGSDSASAPKGGPSDDADSSLVGDQPSKASVSGSKVTGVKSKTYTGKALAQSPTVTLGGKTLKAGTDYTLSYSDNVKAGTATMTVKGKGSYTGTKQVKFTIAKANMKSAAAKVKAQKYRKGKAVKPSPKLTYKGKALKKGTDYTLSYKNNKKRGTATITVKGKGNFTGSKTVKFKIK